VSLAFDLFWRWLLIGGLAFGGGQATLSLVERTAIADTGWISPEDLSVAVAFAFMTPGPVLILAPFVGYRVDGVFGALAAAVGVFLIPWFLATGAASILRTATQKPWVRAFGRGAAPAVVALLVVSAVSIARSSFTGWPAVVIAAVAIIALNRRMHPFFVLVAGALGGGLISLIHVW
jgi:chromate transporter